MRKFKVTVKKLSECSRLEFKKELNYWIFYGLLIFILLPLWVLIIPETLLTKIIGVVLGFLSGLFIKYIVKFELN